MSDSDDDYAEFGSPLKPIEEDGCPRKRHLTIEEQFAVDKHGRRRFHGAFTGGFSAGFFNTVGSPQGFQPASFKSSKSVRGAVTVQKPEDFMDEEDRGQFGIAPSVLRAKEDYHGSSTSRRKFPESDGSGIGGSELKILLQPVRETIGIKLLRKMGWKPGQGVGPRVSMKEKKRIEENKKKVYGCALPNERNANHSGSDIDDEELKNITFAPNDYPFQLIKPKENLFGLGYKGLDKRSILSAPQAKTKLFLGRKKTITGEAFGVGALEEEDDNIYSHEDMSQYDYALGDNANEGTSEGDDVVGENLYEVFALSFRKKLQSFTPPMLPENPNPVRKVSRFEPLPEKKDSGFESLPEKKDSGFEPLPEKKNSGFEPLPEKKDSGFEPLPEKKDSGFEPLPEKKDSGFEPLPEKKDSRFEPLPAKKEPRFEPLPVMKDTRFEPLPAKKEPRFEPLPVMKDSRFESFPDTKYSRRLSPSPERKSIAEEAEELQREARSLTESLSKKQSIFKPFLADMDKQARYEKYLKLVEEGNPDNFINHQPITMSAWEKERERIEFEQTAKLFKPLTGAMGDRFTVASQPDDVNNPVAPVEKLKSGTETDDACKAAEMNMYGSLTRSITVWTPSSVLCKRFNVPEPNAGETPAVKKKSTYSIFDDLETSLQVAQKGYQENKLAQSDTDGSSTLKDTSKLDDLAENKIDLFSAIFLGTDSDEDDDQTAMAGPLTEEERREEERKLAMRYEDTIVNDQRNTSPPRGIFENLDYLAPSKPKDDAAETTGRKKRVPIGKDYGSEDDESDDDYTKDYDKNEARGQDASSSRYYGPKLPEIFTVRRFDYVPEPHFSYWVERPAQSERRRHHEERNRNYEDRNRHYDHHGETSRRRHKRSKHKSRHEDKRRRYRRSRS